MVRSWKTANQPIKDRSHWTIRKFTSHEEGDCEVRYLVAGGYAPQDLADLDELRRAADP